MIKNMVFDMGNVLIDYDPKRLVSSHVSDEKDAALIRSAIFLTPEWQKCDAGLMSDDELRYAILCRLPQRLHAMANKIFDIWHTHYLPIPAANALVSELKEKGYALYLLSNASMRWFDYQYDYEVFSYFDGFLISANEKLLKPDPRIYLRLCEMFRLEPAECFFVDDQQKNVDGAKAAGFDGFALTDYQYDELRACLAEKGIL